MIGIGKAIEGKDFHCDTCQKQFFGFASGKKNTENSYVYYYHLENDGTIYYNVVCNSDECKDIVESKLPDYCCLWCQRKVKDEWYFNHVTLSEDTSITTSYLICSSDCRIKVFEHFEKCEFIPICSFCRKEGKDLVKCDICKVKYYCSGNCRTIHTYICAENKMSE